MADSIPFKDYYGNELAHLLADKIVAVHPDFNSADFIAYVAQHIQPLELKGRVGLIAEALRRNLPPDYPQALAILMRILDPELDDEDGMFNSGYWVYPIAQFVETYGLDDFDVSTRALYEITKRFSSEFAVRPYLVRYQDEMLSLLRAWARDPNSHVRRWVSEGSRPRLPWGKRLDAFVRDPEPTLALLEMLKDDPSAYVRKSVANHLNDLSKDHPARVLAVARDWYVHGSDNTRWIVRHALRTLIKAGNADALAILGFGGDNPLSGTLILQPEHVRVGEAITLTAEIVHAGEAPIQVIMDYRIHFVRANGKSGVKVFKWATRTIGPSEALVLRKTHQMRPVTTRTYYPGLHRVELQVNGIILAGAAFELAP